MSLPLVIAVDIGNTAIKLGWRAGGEQGLTQVSLGLGSEDWATSFVAQLPTAPWPRRWMVSSVNHAALGILTRVVREQFPEDEMHVLGLQDIPLVVSVRNPERVGMDRLLGAWGALGRVSTPSVISVDIGSAVTVDLVSDRVFVGGAIFPGARLQLQSLRAGTDQLPEVALPKTTDASGRIEVPGKETSTAIQCGVVIGIAGAIDRLVERYRQLEGQVLPVVMTGGDASLIRPHMATECLLAQDAVLEAILQIAAS